MLKWNLNSHHTQNHFHWGPYWDWWSEFCKPQIMMGQPPFHPWPFQSPLTSCCFNSPSFLCSVNILSLPLDQITVLKLEFKISEITEGDRPSYEFVLRMNSPFLWGPMHSFLPHSSSCGIICTCLIYFQTLGRPCILFHLYFHISGMKDFCLTLRNYGQQSKDSKDGMQDPHDWITGENQ